MKYRKVLYEGFMLADLDDLATVTAAPVVFVTVWILTVIVKNRVILLRLPTAAPGGLLSLEVTHHLVSDEPLTLAGHTFDIE